MILRRCLWPIAGMLVSSAMPAAAQDLGAESDTPAIFAPAQTADMDEMITAFKAFCVALFPSQEDFLRSMEQNQRDFTRDTKTKAPWRWQHGADDDFQLDYVTDKMAGGRMPSPQCLVRGDISSDHQHLAMARDIEAALLIDDGHSTGRRRNNTTTWNTINDAGDRMRIFLKTRPKGPTVLDAQLIIIKLTNIETDNASPSSQERP